MEHTVFHLERTRLTQLFFTQTPGRPHNFLADEYQANVSTNRHDGRSLGGQYGSVFVSSTKYVWVHRKACRGNIQYYRISALLFYLLVLVDSMCTPQFFVLLQACGAFALYTCGVQSSLGRAR